MLAFWTKFSTMLRGFWMRGSLRSRRRNQVLGRGAGAAGGPILIDPPAPRLYAVDRVEMWFHPQLCTDTGCVIGLEAEARLRHAGLRLLSPNAYQGQLNHHELLDLSRLALAQGLSGLRNWDQLGVGVDTLTLRLADCQLADSALADILLWELDRQDIPPARLVVAVSCAGMLGRGPNKASANLERLHAAGCLIEIDEYGIGGALHQAQGIQPSRIRLGARFVSGCDLDVDRQRMILAIMALAEHLDLAVTADGIAAKPEHAYLTQLGVAQVQGAAVAPALPLSEVAGYLCDQDGRAVLAMPLRRAG